MAEYPIEVHTARGDFTLEKDDRTGSVNKFMDVHGTPIKVTHDEMIAMHHDPEIEKIKERAEQAEEIGEKALDGAIDDTRTNTVVIKPGKEQSHTDEGKNRERKIEPSSMPLEQQRAFSEGDEVIWHSKKAGKKNGNNDLKAKIIGIKDEKEGVVYVNIQTEDGIKYTTRADRLELVKKNEDKSETEKTLEARLDELEKDLRKRLDHFEKVLAGKAKPGDAEAIKVDGDQSGSKSKEDRKGKEIGNKIGDPGEEEYRKQLDDGTPVILKRSKDGEWTYSRNGDLAVNWFSADTELRKKLWGYDPEMARKAAQGGAGGEGGGPSVNPELNKKLFELNAEEDNLKAQKKRLREEYKNASPERKEEIISEMWALDDARDELDQMRRKVMRGEDIEVASEGSMSPDEEVTEVKEKQKAEEEKKESKRSRLRRHWDRARGASFLPWNFYTRHFIMEEDPKRRKYKNLALLASGILVTALLARYGFHGGGSGGGGHEHAVGPGGPLGPGEHPLPGQEAGAIVPGPDHTPMRGEHGIVHEAFFNGAEGHRRTAITLPEGWHIGHDANGHEIITDNHGGVIVSHAEAHSLAKESGVLSDDAASALRSKGYNVSYMPLQNVTGRESNLYQSVVS